MGRVKGPVAAMLDSARARLLGSPSRELDGSGGPVDGGCDSQPRRDGDVRITKAVITAAGRGARQYPAFDTVQKAMLPLVDRDGLTKPVLQIIAEEALESGIEEICVVAAPGDEGYYRRQFQTFAANLRSAYKGVAWAEEQARRMGDLAAAAAVRRAGRAARLRPRRLVRPGVRRRRAVPAAAGRPPLHLEGGASLRPAVDRPGRSPRGAPRRRSRRPAST